MRIKKLFLKMNKAIFWREICDCPQLVCPHQPNSTSAGDLLVFWQLQKVQTGALGAVQTHSWLPPTSS